MSGSLLRAGRDIQVIYQNLAPSVYRIGFAYMKNKQDAEDVVQEAFLRLLKHGGDFPGLESVKAWLLVTASNLCRDKLRRHSRRELDIDQFPQLAAPDREEDRRVLEAVLALPDRLKDAVYLFYYEGYEAAEIAEMLGEAPGTVRSRLFRARKLLKKRLGGDFDEE